MRCVNNYKQTDLAGIALLEVELNDEHCQPNMPTHIADGAAILEQLKAMQNKIDQLENQIQINHEDTTQRAGHIVRHV